MFRREHLLAALLYLVLSGWVTFPLWLEPASRIQSLGDPLLNSYILWWDHWAAFHQFGDFFSANYFWPHAHALAYGEHLLAQAFLALPFRVLTGNAVALHNFSMMQAYFFSALAAHALAAFYFRSAALATLAGLAYGFAQYRLTQSGHAQLLHGEFLPLMVLGFEWILTAPDRRWKWLLGLASLGQWLSSWYWAVFSFWCLAPYMTARLYTRRRDLSLRLLLGLFAPFGIAALCVIPVAAPYVNLKLKNYFYRPADVTLAESARPSDFLRPPPQSWVAGKLLPLSAASDVSAERSLYPGLGPSLAFLLAIGFALRRNRRAKGEIEADAVPKFPLRLWLSIAALLLIFSFGSRIPIGNGEPSPRYLLLPYVLVERYFPLAQMIRVPARWMLPALLPIALLVPYAVMRIGSSWNQRARRALMGGAMALLTLESLTSPLSFSKVEAYPPPVFVWLRDQPFPSPILELPILPIDDNLAMLHATWHRQPMVNGTNGMFPPGHPRLLRELSSLPSAEAIAKLFENRIRFVVVNLEAPPDVSGPWNEARLRQLEAKASGGARTFDRYIVFDFGN